MELKNYQRRVLRELEDFLQTLEREGTSRKAFDAYWREKDVTLGLPHGPKLYQDTVKGAPHVCMKVPTGGGKTFLACAALKPLFDHMPALTAKMVVWLVPSNAILDQTVKALKDEHHPYRQRMDVDFSGKVMVYTKDMLLTAQQFNPVSVVENVSICVMSYDSLRITNKEGRKAYQENANLLPFVQALKLDQDILSDVPDSALVRILACLSPVVVVDESHNAASKLSVDMLNGLHPSFVLDLTATPRTQSNIISYVSAWELKEENMVKLPVIVYQRNSVNDVLQDAISIRGKLETLAAQARAFGETYIRPIVLFQAQPQVGEQEATFKKIRDKLVAIGIPEEQIAIKTADVDELKNKELLSETCPVRYIITVNALREGWDCPFAYVLATVANKSSQVDVAQIVGRVLRLPNAKAKTSSYLNQSYVLTCSQDFYQTLDSVVKGLKDAGFSGQEAVAVEEPQAEEKDTSAPPVQTAFPPPSGNAGSDPVDEIAPDAIRPFSAGEGESAGYDPADQLFKEADTQTAAKPAAWQGAGGAALPVEVKAGMNEFPLRKATRDLIRAVRLPQFYVKELPGSFFEGQDAPLTFERLLEDFSLQYQDAKIDFNRRAGEMMEVDVEKGEERPRYLRPTGVQSAELIKFFAARPQERRIKDCLHQIREQVGKLDTLDDGDVAAYLNRIVQPMDKDTLTALENDTYFFGQRILEHIKALMKRHAMDTFYHMVETREVFCKPSYAFPETITPREFVPSIAKSAYEAESRMNDEERKMIIDAASLKNVVWWHRIIDRKGFGMEEPFDMYPDFVIGLESGKIVMLETKGWYLWNEDSKKKLRLGRTWARLAGPQYAYYMVFKDLEPGEEGTVRADQFLKILEKL